MNASDEVFYRLALAKGFLAEAEQDLTLKRWRSCVDNSQRAVENTGKTALSLFVFRSRHTIWCGRSRPSYVKKPCRRKFGLCYSRCFLICWRWTSANIF